MEREIGEVAKQLKLFRKWVAYYKSTGDEAETARCLSYCDGLWKALDILRGANADRHSTVEAWYEAHVGQGGKAE